MPSGGMRVDLNHPAIRHLLTSPDGPAAKALIRAAQNVTKGAKRRCPTRTGRLRSSISWDLVPSPLQADVGTDVEYAAIVEFGSKPHIIRSHGPWPLRDRKGVVYGREVHHPGTRAYAYLRGALDDIRRG